MRNLTKKDNVVAECKSQLDACKEFEVLMHKQLQEKDDAILQLQMELTKCKSSMEQLTKEDGEITEIKTEIMTLKNHMQEGLRTWNEVAKVQEENNKWIENAKKQTQKPTCKMINDTIEEERKRKARALHVRITGCQEIEDASNDATKLCTMMGVDNLTHKAAWCVGKNTHLTI